MVVVGLGASGLSAALRAARRGAEVVGLDAVAPGGGASGANGGFLLAGGARFHHQAKAAWGAGIATTLHRVTLDELDGLAEEHPDLVRRRGSLRIAADADEADDCRAHLAALRRDGLAAEPWSGPEGVGILLPDDATFQPLTRVRRLAAAARSAGVRLHAPTSVAAVDGDGVTTDRGAVRARSTIVAIDGGLEDLLPELQGRVRTARLQMLATEPDHGVSLLRPVYRRWGYDYVQQVPTGEILLGGCRDRHPDAEWGAPAEPGAEVQACLGRELDRLGATARVTHRWAARSAFTADRLPVCETLRPGLHVVGAYSGHGNLLGPWCGRRAADAALDGVPTTLLDA